MTNILETEPAASAERATPKLAGRVAFVTGGTRGIGAAIARSLANQGATATVGYSRNRDSAKVTSQIRVGRAGRPEEVARRVHFLATDASCCITGQVWSVNGGVDM